MHNCRTFFLDLYQIELSSFMNYCGKCFLLRSRVTLPVRETFWSLFYRQMSSNRTTIRNKDQGQLWHYNVNQMSNLIAALLFIAYSRPNWGNSCFIYVLHSTISKALPAYYIVHPFEHNRTTHYLNPSGLNKLTWLGHV